MVTLHDDLRSSVQVPRVQRHASGPRVRLFVALVVAQVALLSLLTREGWFFVDDFLFLAQAREEQFSLDFLRLPLFEHFSPLHRVFDFALIRGFGLNWTVAHLVLLALAAACIGAFAALALSLFSRQLAFGLTAAYGTSVAFVRNIDWWTAGVHLFLLTAFSLLTILGFVRWYERRDGRWMAMSLIAYSLALCSHEQAMLVPAYLLLLRMFVLARGCARTLWSERRIWFGYSALTLLCVANFLTQYYHSRQPPSPVLVAKFLVVSLFEGFLPSLVAIKVPEATLISIPVSVLLGALVAAAAVLVSVRRSPKAWSAWAFFGASFVVAVLPLGIGRIGIDGVNVGRELHYLTAPGFLALLALGAAFDPRFAPKQTPIRPAGPVRKILPVAMPVLVALYLVLLIRAGSRVHDSQWERVGVQGYFQRFQRDVAQLRSTGVEPVIMLPGQVPDAVIPAWLFPFNSYQHALALADPTLKFDGPGPRYLVDEEGRLGRADQAVPTVKEP